MQRNISPGNIAKTEFWNGTSWTEVADLETALYVGNGSQQEHQQCFSFRRFLPGPTGVTEEFTANLANKTITAS